MKKLSPAALLKIDTFLNSDQVRPLERKLYLHHFANLPREEVITELARFQNADGGFGHGLEPDLRLPDSSVVATTIAFQHFAEIQALKNDSMVINGCRYLRDQYDAASADWEIMPPNVDDAPHAPWWTYGGNLSESKSNPRAEVIGYLYDYADQFPVEMRQQATESFVHYLLTHADDIEHHDLLCALRLYETAALPQAIKARIEGTLKEIALRLVERDPAQWAIYGVQPLTLVSTPDSMFAPLFGDLLEANLDFVIDQLGEDGYWSPNWTWGAQWQEAWEQAKREWSGVMTLNNLRMLRAFGRLEHSTSAPSPDGKV
ncbi:MAG: hypothetical protein KF726_17175 [Anaerolineae bacterium]|nr:hypothetical protein [Anaerolineae bacterium]